jgi:hypothetical protein
MPDELEIILNKKPRKLIITDNIESFEVNNSESLELELKLDRSCYGWTWRDIGKILFDFGIENSNIIQLNINTVQYKFLYELYKKS